MTGKNRMNDVHSIQPCFNVCLHVAALDKDMAEDQEGHIEAEDSAGIDEPDPSSHPSRQDDERRRLPDLGASPLLCSYTPRLNYIQRGGSCNCRTS